MTTQMESISDLRMQRDAARAEAADLRRQLETAQLQRDAARDAVVNLQAERSALRALLEDERQRTGHANRWRNTAIEEANNARAEAADLRQQLDRERLAAIQHAIWSHWMTYQFSVCERNDDGTMTIPAKKVERWERQAATPYAFLSEAERESDRHQANRILAADTPATGEGE